jgi:hypothetical protein
MSPILGTMPWEHHGPPFLMFHVMPSDMNTFLKFRRLVWFQSINLKSLSLVLVLGTAIFNAGCGKKESPTPVSSNTPVSQVTNAPDAAQPVNQTTPAPAPAVVAPLPTKVDPAEAAKSDTDLPAIVQLNRTILSFRMQYGRNPKSVEEAESAAGIQLPPPPVGKKYAFNNRGLIALVDNSK